MIIVAMTTLNGVGMSLKPRLFNLTVISGLVFSLITFMVIILIQDNVIYQWQYWLLPSAFVIGFLACRGFLAYVCLSEASIGQKICFALSIWSLEPCIEFASKTSEQTSHEKYVDVRGNRLSFAGQIEERP